VTGPGGFIRSIRGLPRPARGPVSLFTGVQLLEPALLERLPDGPSDVVAALYGPLLAEGARLLGVRVAGPWLDFGSPDYYLRSQLRRLGAAAGRRKDGSLVARGARVSPRAQLRRVVVGEGAVVERGAIIEASVVWPGAEIDAGARLRGVVVTSGARVAPGERLANAIALMSGQRRPLSNNP
jgi:mannose-1-phosphate guanylyltransferase